MRCIMRSTDHNKQYRCIRKDNSTSNYLYFQNGKDLAIVRTQIKRVVIPLIYLSSYLLSSATNVIVERKLLSKIHIFLVTYCRCRRIKDNTIRGSEAISSFKERYFISTVQNNCVCLLSTNSLT